MKALILCVFAIRAMSACTVIATEPTWKRWPADVDQVFGSTIGVPPAFIVAPSLVSAKADTLLNARFQTPARLVEFAVTVVNARSMEKSIAVRSITLPLATGERVVKRNHTTKPVTTDGITYLLYDEFITVEGPAKSYTRYFHRAISTSRLPGASSVLWELKLMKGASFAAYQPIYTRFKSSLEMGEH